VIAWVAGVAPVALALGVLAVPYAPRRWVVAAHLVAFGAALVVVLGVLLPHAVGQLGAVAVLIAAAGFFGPLVIERLTHGAGEQLAFAGLLVHQLLDGIQIALTATHGPLVTLAFGAHGAPLVGAAVLATADRAGVRRAAIEGVILLIATCTGIAIGALVPDAVVDPYAAPVEALIGGLLMHVVGHGLTAGSPFRKT
jgi:hypothetical protein